MKKNFFKKLSFVLALAMIVSMITPAAGAFAAAGLKLNASEKYLHLSGISGKNNYNFNIDGTKKKGWTYAWTSSNTKVATVESNGVTTAKGVGSADITVVIKEKGKVVDTLDAEVVVRDNIETVTINNAPAKALAVGEVYDFGRSFVTEAASTTKTSSVTRWTVDPATTAEIDASGNFKASQAGEYTVKALSFQSKSKYNAWLTDAVKYADYVLDTDECKVTVAAGIVDTKQIDTVKFSVEFDSDMSKSDLSKDTAKVYQVINGKQVTSGTEKIKAITFDATGKVATVEMFTSFKVKTDYNFVYGDLVGKFTSASTELSDVKGIVFEDFDVNVNADYADLTDNLLKKVYAVDANGVIILRGSEAGSKLAGVLEFTYEGDLSKGFVTGQTVYIYQSAKGYAATVNAKFTNYLYNETTKVYDTVTFEDKAVVTGVEVDTNLNASTLQYAVATAQPENKKDSADWKTTGISLAAKDDGYQVFTRYKKNNDDADAAYTVAPATGKFAYKSTDESKLIINGNYVYPIAEGVVTVIVNTIGTDGTTLTPVGTFDVTIQAKRTLGGAQIDKAYVTVGNNATYGEDEAKVAVITVTDSMGAKVGPAKVGFGVELSAPKNPANQPVVDIAAVTADPSKDDFGKFDVKVTSKGVDAKAYTFKITVTYADNTKREIPFTVNVLEGNKDADAKKAVNWKLEIGATSVDLKGTDDVKDLSIKVSGYNATGVKVAELTDAQYDIVIKQGGTDIKTAERPDAYSDTAVKVVWGTSPAALKMLEANKTYMITATVTAAGTAVVTDRIAGATIGYASFNVVDSTTKSVVVENPVAANGVTVKKAVQDAFSLYLNGDKLTDAQEANIIAVEYVLNNDADDIANNINRTISSGQSLSVQKVTYEVRNADKNTVVRYEFDVNVTIKVK